MIAFRHSIAPGSGKSAQPLSAFFVIAALLLGITIAFARLEVALFLLVVSGASLLFLIAPLSAIGFLVLLAPLRTLIATESALRMPLDIGQLLLIVALGVWALHRILWQRSFRLAFSLVFIPLIIFIAGTGLSGFTAHSMSAWLNEWLKWIQMLILAIVCLDLARERRWEWLLFFIVLSAVANALVGIYQFFGGSGALHLLINDRFFRAFGTFGQPNPFGGMMGLIAPLCFMASLGYGLRAWALRQHSRSAALPAAMISLFYLGCFGIIAAALLMSWSRGAWLGFAVSMFITLILIPRRAVNALLLMGVVALSVIGLWSTGRLPASIVERVSSAFQETFTTNDVRGVDIDPENYALVERLAHWQAAVNMATEHPYLGVGFGNYEIAYPNYRLLNWKFPLGHAHNYYLNVLAETGIIGLTAYVVLWLLLIGFTMRTRQHPDLLARSVTVGLMGTWTYLLVHSLTDNLYVNNLFLLLAVMFGMLAVLYNQCHSPSHLRT
ncbi:O-antigen ligase family protein [Kamptonema cortianum]|nr:O-antigen ligase family protein [Kamptonema cortianum]